MMLSDRKLTIAKMHNKTRVHASGLSVLIVQRKPVEAIVTSLHFPSLNKQTKNIITGN